jgi:hypothetical protein
MASTNRCMRLGSWRGDRVVFQQGGGQPRTIPGQPSLRLRNTPRPISGEPKMRSASIATPAPYLGVNGTRTNVIERAKSCSNFKRVEVAGAVFGTENRGSNPATPTSLPLAALIFHIAPEALKESNWPRSLSGPSGWQASFRISSRVINSGDMRYNSEPRPDRVSRVDRAGDRFNRPGARSSECRSLNKPYLSRYERLSADPRRSRPVRSPRRTSRSPDAPQIEGQVPRPLASCLAAASRASLPQSGE